MKTNQQLADELLVRKEAALLGGGKEKVVAQHERGLLTARERIDILVDSGTFMELGMLNTSDVSGTEHKSFGDGLLS
ncbi:MAG: methylmalonyl-CoA decarboxylase, partial [Bacillus sp. (in: Bacteria)]|nr:methylmalonyl-CoA decarboxylase [Bacillus sp. (in: firmicutes)]